VPNVIGTRYEAAVRDLEAAGLKLGPVVGPREGHVVKQSPEGGAVVPRQSAVSLTLSATAATKSPSP
jgi:beta-lactam-binding protein with PASTA domain